MHRLMGVWEKAGEAAGVCSRAFQHRWLIQTVKGQITESTKGTWMDLCLAAKKKITREWMKSHIFPHSLGVLINASGLISVCTHSSFTSRYISEDAGRKEWWKAVFRRVHKQQGAAISVLSVSVSSSLSAESALREHAKYRDSPKSAQYHLSSSNQTINLR